MNIMQSGIARLRAFSGSSAVPIGLAALFFILQVRHLPWAAMPGTDEGVYAQIGRLMASGSLPHRDFAFYHMPLLPFLAGIGERMVTITGVRILFLFLNSFAVVPLYFSLLHVSKNKVAATAAVFFYLTYHEMVHHDFRFLAIRQLANDVLIAYLFLGTVGRRWKSSATLQALCGCASGLLFVPAIANIGFVSLSLVWMAPSSKRKSEFVRYCMIGVCAVLPAILWLALVPNAYQQVVIDQLRRSSESKLLRIHNLPDLSMDFRFYVVATVGLACGLFPRVTRALALGMFGVLLSSLLLSSNFYPHYLSIAGPAFAYGIFCGTVSIHALSRGLRRFATPAVAVLIGVLAASHSSLVLPSLLAEWNGNRPVEYAELVRSLNGGGRVLAMQPIYAVSARVDMVDGLLQAYTRPPVGWRTFSESEYEAMAETACSILLDGSLRQALPSGLAERWVARFEKVVENSWATVLRTSNPSCPA